MTRLPRRAGFTLIEVLVAVTLSAAVGLAVAQVMSVTHAAQEAARARARARSLEGALRRRLTADLRGVVPPGGLYAAGLVGEQQTGTMGARDLVDPEVLSEALRRDDPPPLEARDRVSLAVLPQGLPFGEVLPPGEGALWQVVYEIDDDPDTEAEGLVRSVQRVRDLPPGVAAPEPEELSRRVVGLELRYFDGLDWVETWDSSTTETLPQAVRLRLALASDDDVETLAFEVAPWTGLATQLPEAGR